jgi:hypothetical protein
MMLTICCVSRNKSVYVTCLHMLLQIAIFCIQSGHQINIQFVSDITSLPRLMKNSERILWVEYGASLDQESFAKILEKTEITVFPSVVEGINWNNFTTKIKNGSTEPISQMGLEFDTELDRKISDGMYTVKRTTPSVWVMDCKSVVAKVRDAKGEGLKLPHTVEEVFQKFVDKKVKIQAYTKCNILRHYSYECVGNILEAVGVSTKQG